MTPQDEMVSFEDESLQNEISKARDFYKIDFNTHLIPRNLPDFATRYGYGGFIILDHDQEQVEYRGNARIMREGKALFEVPPCSWDVEQRVADMDRDGINLQVVSTLPSLFNYWAKADDTADLCRIINNDMKKVISLYPKRFVGLGTVPMQAPELAIKELRRCVTELDFAGVQIGAHVNEWNLDAPELAPFWEACEELNCCVFVNPWDMDYSRKNRSYNLPQLLGMPYATTRAITTLLLGGILDRFPKLRICFANGGGSFPYLSGRINLGYQAYPDKCAVRCEVEPNKFLGRFACDSLVSNVDSLKLLINVIGENSVVFGTDYPLKLGEMRDSVKGVFPGKIIEESGINEEIKSKIYCHNAFAFLNKNKTDFV